MSLTEHGQANLFLVCLGFTQGGCLIGGFNYFMPKTAGENCRNIATSARVYGKIPFFGNLVCVTE